MGGLYLIPDPARLRESCALARQYGACFEYNDFYDPALLDDAERKTQEQERRVDAILRSRQRG